MTYYYLLTGGTGLLGSYLLRDFLLAGHRMAVLVRPTQTQSGPQRVDASLAHWETSYGPVGANHQSPVPTPPLPRPVVLEGDLCRPDMGLTASDLRWIAGHCRAVIHNAASLAFLGPDHRKEPWLTNIEGTRRMLELCRRCGIQQFHHISTAYVCGLRRGRILETELDVGQETGNDYERSKLEAEKLVRSASLAQPPTIYRPSILVGDSRTGYTSTFHGYYAAVKLAHTLVSQMVRGSITAEFLMRAFHVDGNERKDFVPVDWVSAAITHLASRPEHHGKTYHLTAAEPTPVAVWGRAIQHAVEQYSPLADCSDSTLQDASWFEQMFRRQVEVYRAYWRDDPRFDRAHTAAAAPNLPCPTVNHDMLVQMARFAIQTNFGKARQPARPCGWDARAHIQRLPVASDVRDEPGSRLIHLGLQVSGPGGGQWKLLARDGRVLAAEDGIGEQCTVVFHVTSEMLERLVSRQTSVSQAVREGWVSIAGNGARSAVLEALLQTAVTPGDA
jgi:thioester reductase-like protein